MATNPGGIYNAIPYLAASDVRGGMYPRGTLGAQGQLSPQQLATMMNARVNALSLGRQIEGMPGLAAQTPSIARRLLGRVGSERGSMALPEWIARSKGGAQLPGQMALQDLRATMPTVNNIAGFGEAAAPSLGYNFAGRTALGNIRAMQPMGATVENIAGQAASVPSLGFKMPGMASEVGAVSKAYAGAYPGFNPSSLGNAANALKGAAPVAEELSLAGRAAAALTPEAAAAALAGEAPSAMGWAARFAPQLGLKTLGPASLYAMGGTMAGGLVNQATGVRPLGDALAGAGYGAAIGTIFPGIGTGIGAGAGALLGGGLGLAGIHLAGGGKSGPSISDDQRKLAQHLVQKISRLDPAAGAGARASLRVAKSQGGDAEAQGIQSLLANLPGQVAQAKYMKKNGVGAGGNANLSRNTIQQQMMVGQLMADRARAMQQSGAAQADYIRGLIPELPESFRGMANYDAMTRAANANDMGNAFTGSALAAPVFNQYQNQLSQYAQLLQQAQASQGSSNTSLAALLQSQAA